MYGQISLFIDSPVHLQCKASAVKLMSRSFLHKFCFNTQPDAIIAITFLSQFTLTRNLDFGVKSDLKYLQDVVLSILPLGKGNLLNRLYQTF